MTCTKPNADAPVSTTENSLRSPLLRLPAKARKRIYEHVLSGITWDLTAVAPQRAPLPASLRFPSNYSALLRVSRQLFMETYTLPVSLSTFRKSKDYRFVKFMN